MSSRDSSTDQKLADHSMNAGLTGRRVLIVEDSPVVAPFTADLLAELGCEVVGPAPNMAAARELIDAAGFDAAIMDVHIRGERVFSMWDMLEQWRDRPRLQKPYTLADVEGVLSELLGG